MNKSKVHDFLSMAQLQQTFGFNPKEYESKIKIGAVYEYVDSDHMIAQGKSLKVAKMKLEEIDGEYLRFTKEESKTKYDIDFPKVWGKNEFIFFLYERSFQCITLDD